MDHCIVPVMVPVEKSAVKGSVFEIPRASQQPVRRLVHTIGVPHEPIPTQDERKANVARWGGYLDVQVSEARASDLLYVGASLTSLITRLHPRSHTLWSTLLGTPQYRRAYIAVWLIPTYCCRSVEGWMTELCAPLWSAARRPRGDKTVWEWRDPDLVCPAIEFHPRERRAAHPPLASGASGVYAWLLGKRVREIMIDGAEDRRGRCRKATRRDGGRDDAKEN